MGRKSPNNELSHLYSTSRWRQLRQVIMAEYHHCCAKCGGAVIPRDNRLRGEVDHVVPHNGDVGLFWDPANFYVSGAKRLSERVG